MFANQFSNSKDIYALPHFNYIFHLLHIRLIRFIIFLLFYLSLFFTLIYPKWGENIILFDLSNNKYIHFFLFFTHLFFFLFNHTYYPLLIVFITFVLFFLFYFSTFYLCTCMYPK